MNLKLDKFIETPDNSTKESVSGDKVDEGWAEWQRNQAAWRTLHSQNKRWLGVEGCYQSRKSIEND